METKTLSRIVYGILATGVAISAGGVTYSKMNTTSQIPVLERYEEIKGELKTPLYGVTLGNLESRSPELIPHANKLEAELSEIVKSNPNIAQVREEYEREKQSNERIESYTAVGGLWVSLLSLIPLSLRRRRTTHEEDGKDKQRYTP